MIIYHGHPSPNSIERCREVAPSHTHGAEWSPAKMTPHDWPYILDNGAFVAYTNNEPWDVDAFVGRLSQVDSMPRPPDFVVLPDVVTNPEATKKRSSQWAGVIDERTAFPVQDGIEPEDAVETADRLGAEVIFVGGTVTWKRGIAAEMVTASHEHGLDCHIGRPGDLNWAQSIGADSVDTTSILASEAWDRLRRFEAAAPQATVTDF